MTTVYDVPAKELIDEVANKLKDDKSIKIPEENIFSRTGVNRENSPEDPDWWYVRCASIMRKIYVKNVIGIEHLRAEYGGKKNRGSKPHKARSGSGTIVRRAVQQLEAAGYVTKMRGKGRMLTGKGRSFMDNISFEVQKKIGSAYPGIEKY